MSGQDAATELFAVRVTRFTQASTETAIERLAVAGDLKLWIRIDRVSWLRRDIRVIVHGAPEAIAELRQAIGTIRQVVAAGGPLT